MARQNDTSITLVQFNSSGDTGKNLELIVSKIREYSSKSDLIIFPEYSMIKPDYGNRELMVSIAQEEDGNFINTIKDEAKKNKVYVLANYVERNGSNGKPYNTSLLIDSLGIIVGKYQKLHLFDSYGMRESNVYNFGRLEPEVHSMNGVNIGMEICYDIRFPELSRLYALSGSKIITVQAGFFKGDFKVETWRTLLQSIAMCNGSFIAACGQSGPEFIGHSMLVSPYGKILYEAGEKSEDITFNIDLNETTRYLDSVPVLEARRRDIYDVRGL